MDSHTRHSLFCIAAGVAIPVIAYASFRALSNAKQSAPTRTSGEAFQRDAGQLFRDIVTPPGGEGDRHSRLQMVSRVYDLLDAFHTMSPQAQQAAMIPLARQLSSAVSKSTSRAEMASAATLRQASFMPPSLAGPQDVQTSPSDEIPQELRPIFELIDSFQQLLEGRCPSINDAEFAQASGQIMEQITRVSRVAASIPPVWGTPLLAKCRRVNELMDKRGGQAREGTLPTVTALLERLRAIFLRIRDPAILSGPPIERLRLTTDMMQEVQSILDTLRKHGDNEESRIATEMGGQVLQLLVQMEQLSKDEAGAGERGEASLSTQAGEEASAQLQLISQALQNIFDVLRSPEFEVAPPEVQSGISQQLRQRLEDLNEQAEKLPDREREIVTGIFAQAFNVLATFAVPKGTAEENEGKEEAEEEDPEQQKDGLGARDATLGGAISQLETIFTFLNGEHFEKASPSQKQMLAKELLSRLHLIREVTEAAGAEAAPILTDLLVPLEELLTRMSQMRGPSDEFTEVSETLQEMMKVLTSPSFVQSSLAKKQAIAKSIIPQLEHITSTFVHLSPSERAAAESLVGPLNELLLKIARAKGDDAEQAGEAETAAISVSALRDIMHTIQDPEFAAASPAARTRIIAANIRELQHLEHQCLTMSPAIREQLLPVVRRLLDHMKGLLGGAPRAQEEGEAVAENTSERTRLFKSVVDITNELRDGERRQLFLTEAELAPLRSLLEMVDAVEDLNHEEKANRDTFAAQLTSSAAQPSHQVSTAGGSGDIESFLNVLASVGSMLDTMKFTSPGQLFPVMSLLEKTMAAANASNVDWQSDDEASQAVTALLNKVQAIQASLTAADSAESSAAVARKAVSDIKAQAPTSEAELIPYMRVFQQCVAGVEPTGETVEALDELKEAIFDAKQSLDQRRLERAVETRVADALLEVSDRLRDEEMSNADLEKCGALLSQLSSAAGSEDVRDAVKDIREQIKLRRISNEVAEQGSVFNEDDDGSSNEASTPDTDELLEASIPKTKATPES